MVTKTSVPASFIKGSYYKEYNEIVGKYSNYNTMIAKGSIFYSDLLVEGNDLPDSVLRNKNEGERVVAHTVDIASTYGNSIMPGNIIDVYVKLIDSNNKVVYGSFFENIEVLGVKDRNGKNVFENTEEEREPAFLYLSLPENKYLLYTSMMIISSYNVEYEIEMILVPDTQEYIDENPTASEVSSRYLYDFALNRIQKIDGQEKLYNELLNEMEQKELEKQQKEEQKNEQNQENTETTE